MSITITLNENLTEKLQMKAEIQKISVEELACDILNNAFGPYQENYPTLEEVVAKIKAIPPNPANIHPAQGSLLGALKNTPENPEFDLNTWQKDWEHFEQTLKSITRANDIAEGRG